MCLTVFAYRIHKEYPLVLATNRDEFYERPTRPAQFWDKHPTILAGKDLKAGGTWMGITKNHRFAALTNYRDISGIKKDAPSRGHIVADFLKSEISAVEYFQAFKQKAEEYNGFNLLFGTTDNLYYFNNQHLDLLELEPGYYSLSNAFLNTKWPKTEKALSDFKSQIEKNNLRQDRLFHILRNTQTYPDQLLPSTGLPIEKERMVSSIFILSDNYGTRCSTLLFADPNGESTFIEKSYRPATQEVSHSKHYTF